MILRTGALLALFLLISPVRAQLNDYRYLVVPKQFETFKSPNQYQTSTMVKYFLSQKGLPTVWNDARPPELVADPCSALQVRLADDSNMFTTKVRIRLVDCGDAVVFETQEGSSKIKEFKDAYREAIEEAMKSFDRVNYAYEPPAAAAPTQPSATTAAVQQEKPQAQPTTNTVPREMPAAQPPAVTGRVEQPGPPAAAAATSPDEESETAAAALQEAIPETTAYQVPEPARQAQESETGPQDAPATEAGLLYAQETSDGYQLVDSTPSVKMQLLKTSRADTFIALVDGQPMGTVFREGEAWIHEFYQGGSLTRQPLNIRFY